MKVYLESLDLESHDGWLVSSVTDAALEGEEILLNISVVERSSNVFKGQRFIGRISAGLDSPFKLSVAGSKKEISVKLWQKMLCMKGLCQLFTFNKNEFC